ncbi:MAG: hypothetical protein Kow0068_01010 [Marinilabiliales bacterium]
MLGEWNSGKKIDVARKLLIEMIDSLKNVDNIETALRVYGHQSIVPPQDCSDTRLEVPFAPHNESQIINKLNMLRPKGTTPIAKSLEEAAKDFPECSNCRNVIILITDGIEACDGDPCAISLALQKKGVILRPFIIGIGLDLEFKKTFECVGEYYDAADEQTFRTAINVVISQALNNTTAQVNLLDSDQMPTETDVNMTFYDKNTGQITNNLIHTLNHKGNPDTLTFNPFTTYKMIVHTIPPVTLDSFKLKPGKHTIIAVDAPQGYLLVKCGGLNNDIPIIVRKKDEMKTLNVQKINQTEKYIIGYYDLEILSLPRLYVDDVQIKQSHTTTVEIPELGKVTIITTAVGYGSIYLDKGDDIEWVCNLNTNSLSQTYSLLPGTYKVVYRAKNSKKTIFTIEKSFTITSGRSIVVKLI